VSLLADVRRAVAARIEQFDGTLNVFAYPPTNYTGPAVLILPATDGTYVSFHGTFGPNRLMEINLVARVIVPEGQSIQSAQEVLDDLLSSGDTEDRSLADAISGAAVTIGSEAADIFVSSADDFAVGELALAATTPVVSCDLPVIVRIHRS
jgi:hypothetical protein